MAKILLVSDHHRSGEWIKILIEGGYIPDIARDLDTAYGYLTGAVPGETSTASSYNLIICNDKIKGSENVMGFIADIRSSAWKKGPIIFISAKPKNRFDFDFNKQNVTFASLSLSKSGILETIERLLEKKTLH